MRSGFLHFDLAKKFRVKKSPLYHRLAMEGGLIYLTGKVLKNLGEPTSERNNNSDTVTDS